MANTGEIHHPKSRERTHRKHFAAFGRADKDAKVTGEVIGQASGTKTPGKLVYFKPSRLDPTRMFWILVFEVEPRQSENYRLRLIDESDGHEMGHSTDVDIADTHGPQISCPQNNANLPREFGAYGGTNSNSPVSGSIAPSGPNTFIAQEDASSTPPDWYLYCMVDRPNPPCTLTVTQGGSSAMATGLTFS
ncbi:MAG TPA: hypothetical protein VH643_33175 [Gemmataceae bacterium]|jgi:hypothetical protein